MKRQPYTKEELDALASRMENRLGAQYFYNPVSKVVVVKVTEAHSEECRCDSCVHAYLEAMEKRSNERLEEVKQTLEQFQEIDYIG